MSDKMDGYMEQIEDKLSALYANASYEINKKFAEFTQGFEKQDANMLAQVEAGKITEEEYGQWRNRHIVQSNQYKSTVDEISTMLVNTDVAAMAMVNDAMPMVVAQSYNFTEALGFEAAQKAGLTRGTFQVYNARSVQRIIKDNPNLLKEVDEDVDKNWNREKVNREIVQGMVQGESIPKISERLQRVTNMDENAATRNARTAMTAAENMGRAEAADDLKKQGIPMDEVWSATYDNRTRDSHLMLDGTVRDENGYFGADFLIHPLRYPADPEGDPEEIYNCRCRLSLQLKGIDHSNDKELYEQFIQKNFPETWKNLQENEGYQAKQEQEKAALERKEQLLASKDNRMIPPPEKISLEDITQDKAILPIDKITDEETTDATPKPIEALPSVDDLIPADDLSSGDTGVVQGKDITQTWKRRQEEFPNRIDDVIDAQGFNGLPKVVSEEEFNKAVKESNFIAQRIYGASSMEEVQAYRDQLYYGDFYVSCSVGGCQYGQGMYCAADYTGTLTDGIKAEMSHYQEMANERFGGERTKEERLEEALAMAKTQMADFPMPEERDEYIELIKFSKTNADYSRFSSIEDQLTEKVGWEKADEYYKQANTIWNDVKDYNDAYTLTETFTLTPDAKILTAHDQEEAMKYLENDFVMNRLTDDKQKELLNNFSEIDNQIDKEKDAKKIDLLYEERNKITSTEDWKEIREYRDEFNSKYGGLDAGVAATLLGYDAINAEGHGESGSYTVILNRTKVIFKEDKK